MSLKIAVALAFTIALAAFGWKMKHTGIVEGKAEIQALWDADTMQVLADDAKNLNERIKSNAKVDQKHQSEKAQLQARANDADATLNSLRDTINTAPSNDTTTACRVDVGRTERELFGQCAAALVTVAKEADRVESKLNALQDYVSTVVKP